MLLLFAALYWVTFLIGLLDLSFLDFDLDAEPDLSLDLDADADADVDADSDGGSFGMKVLHFVNLDAVPFMVWVSFTALFFWAGNLLAQVNVDPTFAGILPQLQRRRQADRLPGTDLPPRNWRLRRPTWPS